MVGSDKSQSLPLNFTQDFLPERQLIARLLVFAAENGSGDKIQISAETGIPTGESSGKVEPMIYYALGMGLIKTGKNSKCWQLELTNLGKVIVEEDPYLSESVTLWLMHIMLCRRSSLNDRIIGVADAWFALFAEGSLRLGNSFDQDAYLNYLIERHGTKGYLKGLAGLVLRSYIETMCFGSINALLTETLDGQTLYLRQRAPIGYSYYPAYSASLFIIWDELYFDHDQISIDDLFIQSRFLSVLGWDRATAAPWLDWMTDHGLLQFDRQTGSSLALRLQSTERVISRIYSELV